ncbi:hypothetical protein BU17DRAFT_65709 [Hysterangium stoloniferum]|nr:hypothetical protein BU17DRAFT_65709 [Hysterangium stoloniferum]
MLNLDTTAGSGGLQLDESELMFIKEKEKMQILKNCLKQCTKCGEKVDCKVNKHAMHVPLTLVQIHAWACVIIFHQTLAQDSFCTYTSHWSLHIDMTNATAPFAIMMHAPPVAQAPTVRSLCDLTISTDRTKLSLLMQYDT